MTKGSGEPGNPMRRASVAMDDAWRRWCAENVLLGSSEASMVQAMLNAGVDRTTAIAEVRAAANHPYVRAARQLGAVRAPGGGTLEAKVEKRDWVLECYRRSARQASWHGQVPRVPKLSRQQFLDEYYALNRPVVMTGAMDDWPAFTRWSFPELKRRFGERVVSVQANRSSDPKYEQNSERLRREMTFGEYVEQVESCGESNDFYITANNSGANREALKELWDDIVLFPNYLRDDDPNNRGFFWFGPKGTVTPLHHDLTNNFMAQVTQVDLDRIDYERFPLFRNVTITDVEIGPGDLLYLPVGWWHHVRGLEISITMTFTNFVFDNDFYSFYRTYQDI